MRLLHTKNFSFAKECKKMRAFAHIFRKKTQIYAKQNQDSFSPFLENISASATCLAIALAMAEAESTTKN